MLMHSASLGRTRNHEGGGPRRDGWEDERDEGDRSQSSMWRDFFLRRDPAESVPSAGGSKSACVGLGKRVEQRWQILNVALTDNKDVNCPQLLNVLS